jgi:hypothetical protein
MIIIYDGNTFVEQATGEGSKAQNVLFHYHHQLSPKMALYIKAKMMDR